MSVSLQEAIEAAGYDLNLVEDAEWLLSKVSEFEVLVAKAEDLIESVKALEDEAAEVEYCKEFPEEE